MIGVDVGSEVVKWFNGKLFGTGLPEERGVVAGVSSKTVFIKKAFYPLCRGHQLRKLLLNDISSDIGVLPEDIAVSFCPVKKEKEGCELLVFVERRETLEQIEESLKDLTAVTVDIVGVATATRLIYGEDDLTVIDAGVSKTAILELSGGRLTSVEVVRAGFKALRSSPSLLSDRIFPLLRSKRVILVGGGALDGDFVKLLKEKFDVEIPEFEPFGKETPLYFGAFGLFHFRKSLCKASFKEFSILSSDFFTKNRKKLVASVLMVLSGLTLLTAAKYVAYLQVKGNYADFKREYKKAVEKVLGERVVAPEEQLSQAISKFKRLRELLLIQKPSVLIYLKKISDSVVDGVKVLKVEGSSTSDSFKITGLSESSEVLGNFTERLKKGFSKVNTDVTKETSKGIKFTITVSGVKGG
jgi:hypothetical protein